MLVVILGEPATFATSGEKDWKEKLAQGIQPCQKEKNYRGIALRFKLSSHTRNCQPYDLDNLVEPVLSILIGKKGYFCGKRTNLEWWYARKDIGKPAGVEIEILEGKPQMVIKSEEIFNDEYRGELPKSATSRGLSEWLISLGFKGRRYERFWVHLNISREREHR